MLQNSSRAPLCPKNLPRTDTVRGGYISTHKNTMPLDITIIYYANLFIMSQIVQNTVGVHRDSGSAEKFSSINTGTHGVLFVHLCALVFGRN